MTDRFSRDISGRLINRRHLMKGSAALGMAAAAGVVSPSYQALAQDVVTLKFYHDKSPWQDFYVETGRSGRESHRRQLGSHPVLRYDVVPGRRSGRAPDQRHARLLYLVVRLPDGGPLQARRACGCLRRLDPGHRRRQSAGVARRSLHIRRKAGSDPGQPLVLGRLLQQEGLRG